MRIWWSGAMAVVAAALAFGVTQGPAWAAGDKATGEIKDRDGKSLGTAEIVATSAGALIKLKLTGLPAGPHAIHFHETGTCEGDLSSAGAIYNPLGASHGFLSEEGPMAGDLTNIHADATGQVEAELLSPFVNLSKDAEESIFDADGTSLVIFEKADDHQTDPEGNSGARIACGAITLAK
jgi:superoxide dismutase, Cu-Zn family